MEEKELKKTSIYDVLVAIINGFFNLFKIEKIACIIILYILYRDYYVVHTIEDNESLSKLLIDTKIIERLVSDDNTLILVLSGIIVLLLIVIFIFIFWVRPMYIKEINRLAEVRMTLMHEKENGKMKPIKKHKTSKRV